MDIEELKNLAKKNDKVARSYFLEKTCKNCIGTYLQKRRDCSATKGYNQVGCHLMDKYLKRTDEAVDYFILLGGFKALTSNKTKEQE